MPSSICLRCLKRSLVPAELHLTPNAIQRTPFSSTSFLLANPPKKKSVVAKPAARTGRTLKLAKNRRATTARPPAPGERKALRKRVVLSNTNALEVDGLADLTTESVKPERLREAEGEVLGLGNDTVDALRALEAFKPTQGWSLFRRPASLARRETVELGRLLQGITDSKQTERRLLFGDKGSGKSVLMLQGIAMAYLKGWLVIHFPEARDITIAHTSYRPEKTADEQTVYIQPHYTAQLLSNIAKANHGLLNTLRLSKKHELPVPVQSNISLTRFVELGAKDPELAWPIWKALMSELTTPSRPEKEGLQRPPLFMGMDGVEHVMRPSAYLDAESNQVHAHDLAIVRDFISRLSGKAALPNGGMVLASTSASSKPSTPTLDHYLTGRDAEKYITTLVDLRNRLRKAAKEAIETGRDAREVDFGELHEDMVLNFPRELGNAYQQLLGGIHRLQGVPIPGKEYGLADFVSTLDSIEVQLPQWDPYKPIDQRVADVMKSVNVQKLHGLSKEEARGIMEYYARSGMMRGSVTDGLVSERWAMAGMGIIGELERAALRLRF